MRYNEDWYCSLTLCVYSLLCPIDWSIKGTLQQRARIVMIMRTCRALSHLTWIILMSHKTIHFKNLSYINWLFPPSHTLCRSLSLVAHNSTLRDKRRTLTMTIKCMSLTPRAMSFVAIRKWYERREEERMEWRESSSNRHDNDNGEQCSDCESFNSITNVGTYNLFDISHCIRLSVWLLFFSLSLDILAMNNTSAEQGIA